MTATIDQRLDQLHLAQCAFVDCVEAKLNPTLSAVNTPHDGQAEYDVVIGGRGIEAVVHEGIVAAIKIAERHGGRLWLDVGGELTIVWPLEADRAPGPGKAEDRSPAEQERIAARGRGRNRKAAP